MCWTPLAIAPPSGNGVFLVNDDEGGLHVDCEKWLEGLAPNAPISQYQHYHTGEACPDRNQRDNADAHLKRQVMGPEVVVAVTNGRPDGSTELAEVFGTWEQIFYSECDGGRRKRVLVKIIGE